MAVFRLGVDKQWTNIEGPAARRLEIKNKYRPEYTRTWKRNNALKNRSAVTF